jgi:hypothetical protein
LHAAIASNIAGCTPEWLSLPNDLIVVGIYGGKGKNFFHPDVVFGLVFALLQL